MAKYKRHKTNYPGVYYIMGTHVSSGKPERVYYIRYRKDGKMIEEKAGRQFQNDMTPAKASRIRGKRIDGDEVSNEERRKAEEGTWSLDKIWEEYKRQNSHLKGLKIDAYRFKKHLKPPLGHKPPSEIYTIDVDRLRLRKLKGKSPQSIKLVLSLLKRIINFGVKKGLCPAPDPAKLHITIPKVDNTTTEDLAPDQLKKLLKTLDESANQPVACMMKLALYTGMRRGEMFKLKWSDIDFENEFITLRNPNGGKTESIPLNDAARGVFESLSRTDSPYVFPGRGGKQRKNVTPQINKIKEDAGLPTNFRPLHGLRHVYASMLASSGQVDMYTLQKLLTHKSAAMTQRYAHLRDEALQKASGVADALIIEMRQKANGE